MAYNTRSAKESEAALREMDTRRGYAEGQAARGQSETPPPAPAARRFGTGQGAAPAPVPASSTPASAPDPASAPASSPLASRPRFGNRDDAASDAKPASFHRAPLHVPPPEEMPVGSQPRGYVNRLSAPHAPSRPGLTWRLERLIDEVGAFRGFSPERLEQIKDEAAKRPEDALRAYQEVYQREVAPFKQNAVHSIQEAIQKNPGKTVFVVQRGQQVEYDIQEPGGLNDLFHGTFIESISMRKTPFPAPAELLAQVAQERQRRLPASAREDQNVSAEAAAESTPADADEPFDPGQVDAEVDMDANPFKTASGVTGTRFGRPRG